LRPNLTDGAMALLLVCPGSVLGDAAERPVEQVKLDGRQRVQQELADRLRVHSRGLAEHAAPLRGDAHQHPAPVVGALARVSQPLRPSRATARLSEGCVSRTAESSSPSHRPAGGADSSRSRIWKPLMLRPQVCARPEVSWSVIRA